MSYVKLPTTVSDHAVGFQTVNQANDNGEALLDLYAEKHMVPGVTATAGAGFWVRNFAGKHNDILIARATADFYVDSTNFTPALGARLSSGIFGTIAPQRIDAGVWRIYIATSQNFFCVATPRATAAGERKADCYISSGPSGSLVIVSTWEKSGGWATADMDFSLCVWGQFPST